MESAGEKMPDHHTVSPSLQWPGFEPSCSASTLNQRGCFVYVLPRGKASTPFGLFDHSRRMLLGSPANLFRWWHV